MGRMRRRRGGGGGEGGGKGKEEEEESRMSVLDLLSQVVTSPAAVQVPHTNGTVD